MQGRPLIDVLFEDPSMPDKPKKRGGGDTHRLAGDRGVVVYFTPAEYAKLQAAAKAAGKTLKAFCKETVMARPEIAGPR